MTAAIEAVVSIEGPIHLSVLHERLRAAWDVGRIGARIRVNIEAAIRQAMVLRDGDFISGADPGGPLLYGPLSQPASAISVRCMTTSSRRR
jgi:hypothetical protein